MKRTVVWTPRARADLLQAVRYIETENPRAAKRTCGRIEKTASDLAAFATGRAGRVTGVYEKIVSGSPFILAYRLMAKPGGGDRVVILHVIHMARDWPAGGWPKD